MPPAERDPYAVLGIGRDATQEDIKAAFRERALECHPDRVADGKKTAAKDEFLRVQEAFDVLSDPERRAAYDANGGPEAEGTTNGAASGSPSRSRSFKEAWRRNQSKRVRVRRSVFENIRGGWVDREAVDQATSVAVPLCAFLGFVLFVYRPNAIYATDIYLVDLALCTLLGGAHGYVLGSAWGHLGLAWDRMRPSS